VLIAATISLTPAFLIHQEDPDRLIICVANEDKGALGARMIDLLKENELLDIRVMPRGACIRQLSSDRAEAVKQALVKKYNFDPNKFSVEGKGWDEPANADDPMNQALNRRVEVSVYPPESK
jgi:hypothetical protein